MDVTKAVRDISQLTPIAQKACNLFLEKCKKQGLNVLITETYRSQERQNYLYEQGRTRPGNVVTWTKNSRHTSRRAWDIAKNVKGEEYSDRSFFVACGKIAAELGIIWGGTWKTPDTPHFEVSTDWTEPKGDIDMEELREIQEALEFLTVAVNALGDRITKLENPMVYNYIDRNMPEWARPTVQKLVDEGKLVGNENGELGLTEDLLKALVILNR